MSTAQNKVIARRWLEEFWNARNPRVAEEMLHPDYVYGAVEGYSAGAQSVQANKEGFDFWCKVLPDIHFTLDEVIAEGDTVVVRWTARATHQGEWDTGIGKLPASGRLLIIPGTTSYHFEDGKITRDVNHIDFLSAFQQVGAVVQPGKTE